MFQRFLSCLQCPGRPRQDPEYAGAREKLRQAGLSEARLRKMPPDDRVAALEQARLDPYDYIFLGC